METKKVMKHIAIIGGGPSGLFMYKRLIESGAKELDVHIFERKGNLGSGMPYSREGASEEHITNVSDNEIPMIVCSIEDWVKTAPQPLLEKFHIDPERFNEYKVLPRLFFGEYLSAQFDLLRELGDKKGISTSIHLNCEISDIEDLPEQNQVSVKVLNKETLLFDAVVICTGHNWPKKHEGKVKGYFDSPYPPQKLVGRTNHAVAIRGASLTAIDALRTLARQNGYFFENNGKLEYALDKDSPNFKMIMHSRGGMLPAVRFHLKDSHLKKEGLLSKDDLVQHRKDNGGFISLDYIFEHNFKSQFKDEEPAFYDWIREMDLETFVHEMMNMRENVPPFELIKREYQEAEKSIRRKESIYWKEMLAILSFEMNYPAKYFCAEDMQRMQRVLMPLISMVIAFVPQDSCKELMAMHDAGILDLMSVGQDSSVEPSVKGGADYHYTDEQGEKLVVHYNTFVDSIGQPHLSYEDFPFQGLIEHGTICPAVIKFMDTQHGEKEMQNGNESVIANKAGDYLLRVPGIMINDNFQVNDENGIANERIYIMAVPYIGGFNPDYSGLDFCEAASKNIISTLLE